MNTQRVVPGLSCVFSVVLLLVVFGCSAEAVQCGGKFVGNAGTRIKFRINDDWLFIDSGVFRAQWTQLDDSSWSKVNLPHTWNAEDCFSEDKGYRRGVGWYRKRLVLGDELNGKRLYLYFEGACQVADVFVNGGAVAHHEGGFSGFAVDITDFVKFGEGVENIIAVKVDNSWNKDIAPLGEVGFVVYGGLYRDVWLIATDEVHIDVMDEAGPGVYIDTPEVSSASASVRVRGKVVNDSNESKNVRIVNRIFDAENKEVVSVKSSLTIGAGKREEFLQTAEIANPKLWSPDEPYLYKVCTEVFDGEKLADYVENRLGVRWFKFDANEGFFLNGKHLKLKGTNRHQDYPGRGSALSNELHRKDMELIKQMGANFLRLAHYQQDESVLEAADELGILIWEEIPVTFYINTDKAFEDNCKVMLREMIYQHYNHPSVILWGYINEPLLRNWDGEKTKKSEEYKQASVELAKSLDGFVRQLDPSRATVLAINGTSYHKIGMSDVPQVLGWNRYSGWYGGGPNDFGVGMDKEFEQYPDRVIIVSEYGAASDKRLHSLGPNRMDFTCEYAQMLHESVLRQVNQRDYIAGSAVWSQIDFCNPYNQDTIPALNQKGLLYYDRTPKDIYYFYKANYSDEPVLRIASRDWSRRTGTDLDAPLGSGKHAVDQPVKVYSNLDKAELFVNGKSIGEKRMDEVCVATWLVPFEDGVNILEAKGLQDGKEIRDRCEVHFTYRAPILADDSVPFGELAVNVGSSVQFTDENGLVWEAEQKYRAGAWGHVGGERKKLGKRARKSKNVLGTDEDPLYQRFLTGVESYRFDVPDGEYQVELRTCEYENRQAGERVFGVEINGRSVIEGLDLAAGYGVRRAFSKCFKVEVVGGKGVSIDFKPVKGQAILCAVRIKKL